MSTVNFLSIYINKIKNLNMPVVRHTKTNFIYSAGTGKGNLVKNGKEMVFCKEMVFICIIKCFVFLLRYLLIFRQIEILRNHNFE